MTDHAPGPGRFADGVRLSVGTLTAFPTPPPRRVDRGVAGMAMCLAPAVGALLAVVVVPAAVLVRMGALPPLLTAALLAGVLALATRGMHLDGLADTVDAYGSGWDRDKSLAVMRSGDIGPMGAAALGLVLLVDVTAIADLLPRTGGPVLVVLALIVSRSVLPLAVVTGVPSARPDGLGRLVAGSVGHGAAVTTVGVVFAATAGLGVLGGATWYAGPVLLVVALLSGSLLVKAAIARFGGITGDVLGAAVEIALALALVVAVLVTG